MILAGVGWPAGVVSSRPGCSGCSACGFCTMSRQETLDSGTYQSELLMPGAEPLWGFGENLGEFTSVTPTPFLCEILVGTLGCHCWLTSMTVGKQRYRYRCETSDHLKAALRRFLLRGKIVGKGDRMSEAWLRLQCSWKNNTMHQITMLEPLISPFMLHVLLRMFWRPGRPVSMDHLLLSHVLSCCCYFWIQWPRYLMVGSFITVSSSSAAKLQFFSKPLQFKSSVFWCSGSVQCSWWTERRGQSCDASHMTKISMEDTTRDWCNSCFFCLFSLNGTVVESELNWWSCCFVQIGLSLQILWHHLLQ